MAGKLSHLNKKGDVHMVNVGEKNTTNRRAIAAGSIQMETSTLDLIMNQQHKKGDVLAVSRVAGIMAAKKTSELIPLCHQIPLTHIDIQLQADESSSSIVCTVLVETNAVTGVEMEALMAAQVALLTIYDMCKSVDRGMMIKDVSLMEKTGGKSGDWFRSK